MSVFLSIVLCLPLVNSFVGKPLTFQYMLDSTNVVVIAKVNSIWYSMDTIEGIVNDKPFRRVTPITIVSSSIIALYTKNDSLLLPQGSFKIVYEGGECPDGSFLLNPDGPKFTTREVFLAALFDRPLQNSKTDHLYNVHPLMKYTIANDSVYLFTERPMPLCDAICKLSASFIQKANQ